MKTVFPLALAAFLQRRGSQYAKRALESNLFLRGGIINVFLSILFSIDFPNFVFHYHFHLFPVFGQVHKLRIGNSTTKMVAGIWGKKALNCSHKTLLLKTTAIVHIIKIIRINNSKKKKLKRNGEGNNNNNTSSINVACLIQARTASAV